VLFVADSFAMVEDDLGRFFEGFDDDSYGRFIVGSGRASA
jgi:hypothetical protein